MKPAEKFLGVSVREGHAGDLVDFLLYWTFIINSVKFDINELELYGTIILDRFRITKSGDRFFWL